MRIDSHHHLWQYSAQEYDWIDDKMSVLKQDFLLPELEQQLDAAVMEGSVVVQARQSMEETLWLCELAQTNEKIKGIVGWVDLCSEQLAQDLKCLKKYPKLKGFRHVLQGEPVEFMAQKSFIAGLKTLAEFGFKYDLLIYTDQLPAAIEMLSHVPELEVVIDHIAKPNIATGKQFDEWFSAMSELAQNPKVYCKVSGMVTEADWHNWTQEDFLPYLSAVHQLFGINRLMFGSDWPVCLVSTSYQGVMAIVESYFNELSAQEKAQVWGQTAINFYQLADV